MISSNTPYLEDPIRRIGKRSSNIPEYYNYSINTKPYIRVLQAFNHQVRYQNNLGAEEGQRRALSHRKTLEIDDPSTSMEEYVQFETEKSLRNGQVYNWETGKSGKIIWCLDTVDTDILRFFETKFPAIVYDDALNFESDFSSKPALNSELTDDIDLENETSSPEYNYKVYNSKAEKKL
ncbi:hypothetical protein Tco_0672921 [Tanacetum coccineum]